MLALINAAWTVIPLALICIAVRLFMRRRDKDVELSEVQKQAGSNRRPRKVFLLGFWRTED